MFVQMSVFAGNDIMDYLIKQSISTCVCVFNYLLGALLLQCDFDL